MKELLQEIANNPHMTKHEYFKLVLLHSEEIVKSTTINGKTHTAKALNMSPQSFSIVFPVITAYTALQEV